MASIVKLVPGGESLASNAGDWFQLARESRSSTGGRRRCDTGADGRGVYEENCAVVRRHLKGDRGPALDTVVSRQGVDHPQNGHVGRTEHACVFFSPPQSMNNLMAFLTKPNLNSRVRRRRLRSRPMLRRWRSPLTRRMSKDLHPVTRPVMETSLMSSTRSQPRCLRSEYRPDQMEDSVRRPPGERPHMTPCWEMYIRRVGL